MSDMPRDDHRLRHYSLFYTGGVIMLRALSLNLRFLVSVSVLPEAVCENIYLILILQAEQQYWFVGPIISSIS
jgi:hypothetical protein